MNFPFENYKRIAGFMRSCKGKVVVSINDYPDIRREFDGIHLETLDILCCNTKRRKKPAEVCGDL
ncbi:hypothetical protein PFUM301597_55040 [Pseudomonas fluorescens]